MNILTLIADFIGYLFIRICNRLRYIHVSQTWSNLILPKCIPRKGKFLVNKQHLFSWTMITNTRVELSQTDQYDQYPGELLLHTLSEDQGSNDAVVRSNLYIA